jgi:tetratricopeptide (TPR) repeat protein
LTEAVAEIQRALAVFELAGDPGLLARTHQAMALVLMRRDTDDLLALQHANRALDLIIGLDHQIWEAEMRDLVASCLTRLNKLDDARQEGERALILFREGGDEPGAADVLDTLGEIAQRAGRHAGAVDYYRQAAEIYHEINNVASVAGLDERRGHALLGLGDPAAARQAWQLALDRFQAQDRTHDVQRVRELLADLGED